MGDKKHWSDASLKGCFQKENAGIRYGIPLSHDRNLVFATYDATNAFINEFAAFMQEPPFDQIDNMTKKEAEEPQLYAERMARTIPTTWDLFAFSKFSRFSTDYWMGAGKRESFFDPEDDDPKKGTFGPLQIKEAYFTDAIEHVKDPFCIFGEYIERAQDPNVPIDVKLADARDPLWAAALKDAYLEYYLDRLKLPDDERSLYLLHLGSGHASRMAKALREAPDTTVDKIFGKRAYADGNEALMRKDNGSFKTAKEFWDDLPNLGIPAGAIPDKPSWDLTYAQIEQGLPRDDIGVEKPLNPNDLKAALEAQSEGAETTSLPLKP